MEPVVIDVDGRRFSVLREGPGAPLHVKTSQGKTFQWLPVCLDDHLRVLEKHVHANERGLSFDREGFCATLLEAAGVPEAFFEELEPLMLWWAAGGADVDVEPGIDEAGWIDLGAGRVKLRPWTWVERERAMRESTTVLPNGAQQFSLERYMLAMIRCSVVDVAPNGLTLDDVAAARLVDAVVAVNTSGGRDEDRMLGVGDAASQALAQTTLRLCKMLGWTPSQVWSLPAAELDRLMAMLRLTESAAVPVARAARPTGLASYPDAVVIQVEDG